jgi:hypothetical protein
MLLQHTQEKRHKGTFRNTVIFKRPPLGPLVLLRSVEKDIDSNYMQLPKANQIKEHP